MTTKKPTDLKIRRGIRNQKGLKSKPRKDEPWYASAALQIGITTKVPAREDKSTETFIGTSSDSCMHGN